MTSKIATWVLATLGVLAVGFGLVMRTTSLPKAFEARRVKAILAPREAARPLADADTVTVQNDLALVTSPRLTAYEAK